METIDNYKVSFIIAHKYFRGYESFLKYYVEQIFKFYNDALVIIVDNNSNFKDDVFDTLPKNENIVLLDNNIDCKFEIGAYQVGINYLRENNLIEKYDYYFCTQDNFVIKNKVDFNEWVSNDITACPINSYFPDGMCEPITSNVLKSLNLYDNLDKITFCWCSSFIIAKEKLEQLDGYFKKITITVRWESCASERYLARILWELNGHKNNDIDGDIRVLRNLYDCWTVDIYADSPSFFVKRTQQKNEKTIDK